MYKIELTNTYHLTAYLENVITSIKTREAELKLYM